MKCKCKNDMTFLMSDEFSELYVCRKCSLLALRNLEAINNIVFYTEVKR
jgi:hypothetical protein